MNKVENTRLSELAQKELIAISEVLLKTALLDQGTIMQQDLFSHTVNRLVELLPKQHPTMTLHELKYVFDSMLEKAKWKICVTTIMQLVSQYKEIKIERQRTMIEAREFETIQNAVNCENLPLGDAMLLKWSLEERGLLNDNLKELSLCQIAAKIKSGELIYNAPSRTRRKQV